MLEPRYDRLDQSVWGVTPVRFIGAIGDADVWVDPEGPVVCGPHERRMWYIARSARVGMDGRLGWHVSHWPSEGRKELQDAVLALTRIYAPEALE